MKKLSLSVLSLLLCVTFAQINDADIYYEIFVRSFQDTDGDGVGDLRGVVERLDYLQDLGVTGLWLTPIHPSPSYHGYDVTDYYDINPDYGTLEDFDALVVEAEARDMDIILDLVVNHSSSQHPWFLDATSGGNFRDYYSWLEEDPGWRGTGGGPAWHSSGEDYYLGLFWSEMPDLNYRNPAVVAEMQKVARFWLERGADGFRVDAIQHIFESEDGQIRSQPETFTWLSDFEAFIKTVNPAAFIVGETWTDTGTIVKYHEDGDLDMSFNYPLWDAVLSSISGRSASDLAVTLNQDEELYPANTRRGTFISNHDQIRPGTSLSALRRDEARLKLAAGLLLTLPGTPFIYYGEEIGMPNGEGGKDEEKRTPMLWDSSENFGFSEAAPWHAFSTQDQAIAVEAQAADPDSVLNFYKTFVELRKTNPALNAGTTQVLESEERALLALEREANGQKVLVLANMGTRDLEIDLSSYGAQDALNLTGESVSAVLGGLEVRVLELP